MSLIRVYLYGAAISAAAFTVFAARPLTSPAIGTTMARPAFASREAPGLSCEAGHDCSEAVMAEISGGVAYVKGTTDLVALSAATGSPLWHFSVEQGWLTGNIAAVGGLLVVSGTTVGPCGPVYAIDATSGRLRWQRNDSSCHVWPSEGRVYLQHGQGDGLVAVDANTGHEIWSVEAETPRFVQSLVVVNSRIYTDDRIIDGDSGKTVFWWPRNQAASEVLVSGSHVIVATAKGALTSYDRATFAKQWERRRPQQYTIASVSSSGDKVYVVWYEGRKNSARRGTLEAYDIGSGHMKWKHNISSCCSDLDAKPLTVSDGLVVLITPEDRRGGDMILALDGTSGAIRWTTDVKMQLGGPPLVTRGYVFAKGVHGGAVALDAARGSVIWMHTQ